MTWLLIAAALAAGAAYLWGGYRHQQEFERAASERREASAAFEALNASVHRIVQVEVEWPGGGRDGRALLRFEGWRSGRYRLTWFVQDGAFERRLIGGERMLDLRSGAEGVTVPLPASELAAAYRGLLSGPAPNVLVDERMDFRADLIPVLTAAEEAELPETELHNLRRGWSTLIDHGGAELTVRFYFLDGRLSWDGK